MSSLVSALDKHTPKQIGENNHVEYTWSNDINEKIVQFFFQLVRNSSTRWYFQTTSTNFNAT